jgi:ribonuclease HI
MAFPFPHHNAAPECDTHAGRFDELYPANAGARFDPSLWFADRSTPDVLYDYEGHPNGEYDGWTHLTCPARCRCRGCGRRGFSRSDPLIIAVDGACLGNGTANARAAVGVWFGEGDGELGSIHNVSRVTTDTTNQQAEISAAIAALKRYKKIVADDVRDHDRVIILKSDSAYLVNGIATHMPTWKTNGWLNANGQPVANKELWQNLDARVRSAKRNGTRVLFWHVRRNWNTLADALAKDALLPENSPLKYKHVKDAREDYIDEHEEWKEDYVALCEALGYVPPERHEGH